MIMKVTCLIAFLLYGISLFGQSTHVGSDHPLQKINKRWDVLYDFDVETSTTNGSLLRSEILQKAFLLQQKTNLSEQTQKEIQYVINENIEFIESDQNNYLLINEDTLSIDKSEIDYGINKSPLLKYFYKSPANFFQVETENFKLLVNPILNLRYGNAKNDDNIIFQNTRGAELRGMIDKKVYFYTALFENQAFFNNYLLERIQKYQTIPGQGLYKSYNSSIIDNLRGYDYLNAQAYVGLNVSKSIAIELGHGKNFIGDGMRSLIMSEYSHNYFYLKFRTRIWKFDYQNLFTELSPISSAQNPNDRLLPKKYMANHYLSFKPHKNVELGLFEAIIFSREDHFEFQYLNPVILYRTVEQFLDSPDNVLIGLTGKWNILNKFQLYSQIVLDEFKVSEISNSTGWWGNKIGFRIGAKYINAFNIESLDLEVEYNQVRPYTYSHRDTLSNFGNVSTANYSHHNQPLAHPLGANFKEYIIGFSYEPLNNLFIQSRYVHARYGQDNGGLNYGGDILLPSSTRLNDYGNEIGQGILTNMDLFRFDLSYQLFHNYFVDLNYLYRFANAEGEEFDTKTQYLGVGIRVNVSNYNWDY